MNAVYLCLDDEDPERVELLLDRIRRHSVETKIEHQHAAHYPELFDTNSKWNGVILDLRLDEIAEPLTGVRMPFRATTICQELRTRATEGEIADLPVALWSSDSKLAMSYTRDNTGHDLFDLLVVKDRLKEDRYAEKTAHRMHALVCGYGALTNWLSQPAKERVLIHLFGIGEDSAVLDPRVLDFGTQYETPLPVHEYARFIIKSILSFPGPLIGRSLLAARLGVNSEDSTDFDELVNDRLGSALYRGVFGGGWQRWWAALVEAWWDDLKGCPAPLRSLTASERAEFLRDATGLPNILPATPIADDYSSRFWAICQGTLRPLDPRDGFLVSRQTAFPWQDKLYASLKADVNGDLQKKHMRIDPLEFSRLQIARENYR